jgi:hypothetical protein
VRVLCTAGVLVGLLAVTGSAAATQRHVLLTVSITGSGSVRLSDGRRLACSSNDYIGSATDGTNQYFAWGDNRDVVTNFMWTHGRHDPDVFFAKQ